MASKAIELFSKNACVGDIELLYRLAAYTRLAGSYVVQCLMVTKLFLKSTATLWSAPLPVAK